MILPLLSRAAPALVILCSLTTLVLAQCSLLHLPLVILLPAAIAVALRRVLLRGEPGDRPAVPAPVAAGLAVLLGVFSLVAFRPHELIDGGWDPTTYLCGGASVARHHGVSWEDPFLASLTPAERSIVAPSAAAGQKYPGFFADGNRIVPQGQHLYTSLVAVAVQVAGPRGGLYVNPVLALGSILLLFGLALRWKGPVTALVAAALFALNPVQLWNARFATAEIAAQLLLLAAFCLLDRALRRDDPAAALLAALGFALAVQSSVAAAAYAAVPLAAALLPWPEGTSRSRLWFAAGAAAGTAHFVLQAVLLTPRYAALVGSFFRIDRRWALVAALAGAAGCLLPPVSRRIAALLPRAFAGPFPAVGSVALLAAAAWLRPPLLPGEDALTMAALGWYLAPAAAALGVAGLALSLLRPSGRAESLLLLSALAGLLFFAWDLRMIPLFPFSLRRFTPLAVPAIALASAEALRRLAGSRLPLRLPAAACLLALAIAHPLHRTWTMHTTTENRGLLAAVATLDGRIPRGDILLCQERNPAYALEHLFGRTVVLLERVPERQAAAILAWAERRIAAGAPVDLVSSAERPFTARILFSPRFTVDLPLVRQFQDPKRWGPRFRSFLSPATVYRLEAGWGGLVPPPDGGIVVDVGDNPFGLAGFSERVTFRPGEPGAPIGLGRWTGRAARMTVPRPLAGGSLIIRVGSGEGRGEPARLRLSLDGVPLGEVATVPSALAPLVFPIPPASPGAVAWRPAELLLESTTWNPPASRRREIPLSAGVLVDRVTVTPPPAR